MHFGEVSYDQIQNNPNGQSDQRKMSQLTNQTSILPEARDNVDGLALNLIG